MKRATTDRKKHVELASCLPLDDRSFDPQATCSNDTKGGQHTTQPVHCLRHFAFFGLQRVLILLRPPIVYTSHTRGQDQRGYLTVPPHLTQTPTGQTNVTLAARLTLKPLRSPPSAKKCTPYFCRLFDTTKQNIKQETGQEPNRWTLDTLGSLQLHVDRRDGTGRRRHPRCLFKITPPRKKKSRKQAHNPNRRRPRPPTTKTLHRA